MIRAVIIEDELAASDHLASLLADTDPDVTVVKRLTSVADSVRYFSGAPEPDVIFSDVQLEDGLSFAIFKQVSLRTPVVFVTGYDAFVLSALEHNGIDYLLKPLVRPDLEKALQKYGALKSHFGKRHQDDRFGAFIQQMTTPPKDRILVKKGTETLPLLLADVVFFYFEKKVVTARDKTGKRYMVDKTLSSLEKELDRRRFFRVNRQYILNVDYVKRFKPYERVKLWVDLTLEVPGHVITVSQEMAPAFRRWLQGQ